MAENCRKKPSVMKDGDARVKARADANPRRRRANRRATKINHGVDIAAARTVAPQNNGVDIAAA